MLNNEFYHSYLRKKANESKKKTARISTFFFFCTKDPLAASSSIFLRHISLPQPPLKTHAAKRNEGEKKWRRAAASIFGGRLGFGSDCQRQTARSE